MPFGAAKLQKYQKIRKSFGWKYIKIRKSFGRKYIKIRKSRVQKWLLWSRDSFYGAGKRLSWSWKEALSNRRRGSSRPQRRLT